MEGLLEDLRSPDKLRIRSTATSLLWLDRLALPFNTEALLHLFVLPFSAVATKRTSPWANEGKGKENKNLLILVLDKVGQRTSVFMLDQLTTHLVTELGVRLNQRGLYIIYYKNTLKTYKVERCCGTILSG